VSVLSVRDIYDEHMFHTYWEGLIIAHSMMVNVSFKVNNNKQFC
jgi:hypothetical protein